MNPAVHEALAELPALIKAHLMLSGCAVAIGVVVGLPLALWAAENRRVRTPLLGFIGLIQTIPALALLALFYPLLLAIGRVSGLPIPALGFLPALIALSLYALLPIVRNGIAAQQSLDPSVMEAADGVGMTRRQRLFLVELPLGAPIMLAGIRTAAIWTIGAATLATTVGQPSLGNLIFSGLQTENWLRVLIGCAASAALALAADGLLSLVETGVARRSRWRFRLGLGLLVAALVAAFVPTFGPSSERGTIIVGAKNFSEQYILASVIEDRLAKAGYRTERRDDLSRAAPQLRVGSDIEFLSRPEWRSVAAAYGLRFGEQRSYNPTFMYRAISDGSADVISAFSSDGRIAALDLVTLADPRGALPSYDAVLLLSPRRANDRTLIAALTPLIGAIPIDRMRQANLMVDQDEDKRTPAEAGRWLLAEGGPPRDRLPPPRIPHGRASLRD